ncbi:MAG: hypothetical protein AAGI68_13730 [Planctomycetota bacterium]
MRECVGHAVWAVVLMAGGWWVVVGGVVDVSAEDVLDVRGPVVGVGDPREPYGDVPFPQVLAEMDLQSEPEAPAEAGGPYLVHYRNGLIGMSATFVALPADPRAGRSRGRADAARGLVRAAERGLKEQEKAGELADIKRLEDWSGFVGPVGEPIAAHYGLYSYRLAGEARRLVVVGVSRQTGQMTLRLSYPESEAEQSERRASELMLDWGYLLMRGRHPEGDSRRRD